MLEWLISFFLIGTGLWNKSTGLLALGSGLFLFLVIVQFIGSKAREKKITKKETTKKKKKKKYKLIQAPSGAWESDEIYPHMMSPPWASAGLGENVPNADPLKGATKNFDNKLVSGTIRQFLPFPSYGGGPSRRILAGFPIDLSKFLGYKKEED